MDSGSALIQVGSGAFSGCRLSDSLVFSASVESIGTLCFAHSDALKSIQSESGSGLLCIKKRAFRAGVFIEAAVPALIATLTGRSFPSVHFLRL
jgi:hypothetical protein